MNARASFIRKLLYVAAIGLLLVPLYLLSNPATGTVGGVPGKPGGLLAQLRNKHHLSQAQLGEVDPTSVTIKLATLGFRGVAVVILWGKADDYKMKKDWTNLGATLNQITKVQPNYLNVWTHQAWNLSYNVSAAFDGYRDRYHWVIKGFKFLLEGIKHNENQPRLQWELGRMISQKIGRADEAKQFRKLFGADEDFRKSLPPEMHDAGLDYNSRLDNWLVGKEWYRKTVRTVESLGANASPGQGPGQSPLIYRSSAPMCQMNYADAVEKDGAFGEVAKYAWLKAREDWRRYGDEDIMTVYRQENSDKPVMIHLNDQEREEEAAKKTVEELDAIQPGLREKILAEKIKLLTPAQREARDTAPEKRTGKQAELAGQAEEAVKVAHDEVAARVARGPKREAAKKLAKQAVAHERLAQYIRSYRGTVNFEYWRGHAQAEQSQELLTARQLVYQGDQAFDENRLVPAREYYQKGLQAWHKALAAHPEYLTDQTTNDDLVEMIRRYRLILDALGDSFPDPFILQDVLDAQQRLSGAPVKQVDKKSDATKPDVKKSDAKKPDEKTPEAKKTKPDVKNLERKKPEGAKKAPIDRKK
jgi:hypothetical protein